MAAITIQTANSLFQERRYKQAFEQFCLLVEKMENPAFSSFMAGKCLEEMGEITHAADWYTKAVEYDDSNALINREIERFQIRNNLTPPDRKYLLHYFPNTTNIGDSGSAAGIRALFHSLMDCFFFCTLSCRTDTLAQLKALPLSVSGIVIGGGGLYFKQPLASGWYFPLSSTELEELSLPTVTYAIGFNSEYSDNEVWQLDNTFLKHVADFQRYISLKSARDLWTINILEEYGNRDISLVPCPSAFLEPLSWYKPNIPASKNIIGLSITCRSCREGLHSGLITAFTDFAGWLLHHDFFPLFILHDSADDLPLAEHITAKGFTCIIPHTAREAITIYDSCYGAIGMRGHSLIFAAGRCVPFIGVSYNTKVDAFMETINLREYCLNQNDVTEKIVLINAFEKLLVRRDAIATHLKKKRELSLNYNRTFCKKAVEIFLKE